MVSLSEPTPELRASGARLDLSLFNNRTSFDRMTGSTQRGNASPPAGQSTSVPRTALGRQPLHLAVSWRSVPNSCLDNTIRLLVLLALISLKPQLRAAAAAASVPDGVKAVWDVARAYHETTPTRERICLNGLWRWQPAGASSDQVPAGRWGFF